MFKFALKNMMLRRARMALVILSIVLSASVALLSFNISQQVSDGIISTAAYYDMIIGPAGSATQLAMNTMFFTDEPLGTLSYEYVEEIENSGLANSVIPFAMGDSYNSARIIGATPDFLEGKKLKTGEMFADTFEAVLGSAVAERYNLGVGDTLVTSHGLTGSGSSHAANPLVVTGVLAETGTAYDNVIFTSYKTIWTVHDHAETAAEDAQAETALPAETAMVEAAAQSLPSHGATQNTAEGHAEENSATMADEAAGSEAQAVETEEEQDHNSGEICAILIKSKSFNDYYKLNEYYGKNSELLCINPSTVLREVLDQVDLSAKIVYILCAIILLMNIVVISVITLLNMYDAQKEIALMRLIGVSMKRIAQLYLIQNAIIGLISTALALLISHLCLGWTGNFVASMGIVLSTTTIYPMEWAIAALVFVLSVLPTMCRILSMSRKDSLAA